MEKRIPNNMEQLFQNGFLKAFEYLFKNGTSIVEKLGQKEKKQNLFDQNRFSFNKSHSINDIKRFDQEAKKIVIQNDSLATAEGFILGVAGIGLPDIVLFLGMLLKTVYEVGFCFGFSNETTEEKIYILTLLSLAAASPEKTLEIFQDLEALEEKLEDKISLSVSVLEQKKKEASEALASKIVLAKMIQGIPVLGIAGAASNFTLIHRVGQAARLGYKKRFLKKMYQNIKFLKTNPSSNADEIEHDFRIL